MFPSGECADTENAVAFWKKKYEKLRRKAEEVALDNIRLEKLAFRDPLTELLNRHGFEEFYKRICAEEIRNEESPRSCVAIIDIDKFKEVNDTYGHLIGDEVLKSLATSIQDAVRQTDLVCRFGGEEFTVFLHRTAKNGARQLLERVRERVEKKLLVKTKAGQIRITVSIGIAECEVGESFAETLDRADQALYDAKARGRNMVVDV
jgi:diguanylate cyclase (GGDEF)-like protein